MSLEMVFNERSFNSPAANIPTAQQWMNQLIQTIRAAQKLGISTLRTHADFNSAVLATDYSLAQWRNDRNVDRESQRFFRSLQTKSPFIDRQIEVDLQAQTELSEFSHNGLQVIGLGIALLLDALSISLPSALEWQPTQLSIQHCFFDPDTNEIQTKLMDCRHASHPEHILVHQPWIEQRIRFAPWTPEDTVFPCYQQDGKTPLAEWLNQLKDTPAREIIKNRLTQAKAGNWGDYKIFAGIVELRILGLGYRIYCGKVNDSQLIVLWAGNKSSQDEDIKKAVMYWNQWQQSNLKQ